MAVSPSMDGRNKVTRKGTSKVTQAQLKAQEKYDKVNTKQVTLKLNIKTDADILARLDSVSNRQGYIKKLIRDDLAK